jgi:conjugative relaxase-like TrwC/TraI family protein
MLTISQPLSSSQAQKYHAEEFTSRSQAYYAEGDHVRGEWQGRLAEHFGLRRDVRPEEFARLSKGCHPISEEQLVNQRLPHSYKTADGETVKTMGHRAGWDATFSAPKSVSLTALVGNDARLRGAHREAVRTAVDTLERHVQARLGGNRPAETTGNWIVAKFEHDTARPVDGYPAPQLHTHAVFFNMTRTHGGEFRALQPQELFRSQQFATAVYRAELAVRLRELGYEIQVEKNGAPEIKGYSREYLEANSLRSQQIREHLKAAGLNGAAAAQIAAHRTREAKVVRGPEEVTKQHRDLAARYGNEPERIAQRAREHGVQLEPDPHRHARAAVTYARDKTFEREAVADRRDLMKEALTRACGHASLNHVTDAFEQRARQGDLVHADRNRSNSPAERYTTPAMIAAERRNIEFVQQGRDQCKPLARDRIREECAGKSHLNTGQRKAINQILSNRDRVFGLQGVAGSGKTTTLREVRSAAEREGYKVQGLAPTSRATAQLQDAGINAKTLQRHLTEAPGEHAGRNLYVVDEASLASTKQTREFFERMSPHDRALLVGDTRQHQAVDAGRPFEQLQEAGMRTAALDEIVRQRDADLRHVVEDLSQGRIREAVSQLREQGRVHEIPDREQRLNAIAHDYATCGERTLVVAPDNQTRQELNDRIRHELKERGTVTGPDQQVKVLAPRQDMTGADRAWAARYHEGDVIRYTRGSAQLGIAPGEYATVRDVDARQNTLQVQLHKDRWETKYDPQRLRGVAVYETAERSFAKGDRVQLTAPDRSAGLANRELATIERLDSAGNVSIRTDSGRTVTLTGEAKHLDHGYAVTSHSAQGSTADRVIVHAESTQSSALVNERFAYVAGSRMRDGLDIYTDSTQQLPSSLERQFDKTAALTEKALGNSSVGDQVNARPENPNATDVSQSIEAGSGAQRGAANNVRRPVERTSWPSHV